MKILDKSVDIAYQLCDVNVKNPQVFAFVYNRNKLLSIGQNEMEHENAKSLYFGKRYGLHHMVKFPFIHAEVDAISKLWGKYHITGRESVVVVRLKKSGTSEKLRKIFIPALAKPCPNCYNVLTAIGINRIWWTTDSGDFEK